MGEIASNNKTIARNTFLLTIRMVIVLGITMYITRVLLQLLGMVDFGVFNVVCGFVSMFAFLNSAMTNGIQRFYNFELGRNGTIGARKVFNSSLVIQALVAVVILLLTETIGLWYLHNKMVIPAGRISAAEWIYQFSILSFVFVIFQAPYSAAVLAHEKMDFYAVVNIVDTILKLCIVLLLMKTGGDSLVLYGGLLSAISFFDLVLYYIYANRKFEEVIFDRQHFERSLFKSMLSFSGWNVFGSIAGILRDQGLNLVLNFFCGPIANAAAGIATQVNGGVQSFVSNLTIAVRPQVIQSFAQGNIDRTMSLTFSISKVSCLALLLVAYPIVFEINYILKVWLGTDNVPINTPEFVTIIIIISFISTLNQSVSAVVHASGKMRLYQINGGIFALLSVVVAYIALDNGGAPVLVYFSSLFCMIVSQFCSLVILKNIVQYRIADYVSKVVLPLVMVAICMLPTYILANILMEECFLRLFLVFCLSFIVGPVSIYFVAFNNKEKEIVKCYASKLLKK